jgi:hypothetical protein
MAHPRTPATAAGEVGPGRPPKHSRFKPGTSGNPKGRPPRQRDLRKLVEEELDRMVSITEGGRRLKLTKREIIVRMLVNAAARGEDRALATLIKLAGTSVETVNPFSTLDAGQIARFLARHLGGDGGTAAQGDGNGDMAGNRDADDCDGAISHDGDEDDPS